MFLSLSILLPPIPSTSSLSAASSVVIIGKIVISTGSLPSLVWIKTDVLKLVIVESELARHLKVYKMLDGVTQYLIIFEPIT